MVYSPKAVSRPDWTAPRITALFVLRYETCLPAVGSLKLVPPSGCRDLPHKLPKLASAVKKHKPDCTASKKDDFFRSHILCEWLCLAHWREDGAVRSWWFRTSGSSQPAIYAFFNIVFWSLNWKNHFLAHTVIFSACSVWPRDKNISRSRSLALGREGAVLPSLRLRYIRCVIVVRGDFGLILRELGFEVRTQKASALPPARSQRSRGLPFSVNERYGFIRMLWQQCISTRWRSHTTCLLKPLSVSAEVDIAS